MNILFYIALSWFILEFEPFQLFLVWFKSKLPKNETIEYLLGAFDCWKCFTFWLTLAVSWDFKTAVVASFIVFVFELIHELCSQKRR
jgi:hypothetical protein